jgi:catechol 2,3-dioxygenase-like lactoylglutathione lyase family enzyme
MPDTPNIQSWYPVVGIRSWEQAREYYVDWLGFNLDWEWREAPGQPVIAMVTRDGLTLGLNEHEDAATGSWLSLAVADIQSLADEWNGRRPGSVEVVNGMPYEFPVVYLVDPFGNKIDVQQPLTVEEEKHRREVLVPKMREFISQQLADGKPVPTPEEVTAAIGPSVGLAIETLNEFPEYAEAFRTRRED